MPSGFFWIRYVNLTPNHFPSSKKDLNLIILFSSDTMHISLIFDNIIIDKE